MPQELIDFIFTHYFLFIYGITWVIAVLRYRRYFDTPLKYLPILIAYTFFNELLGYFIKYSDSFALFASRLSANELIYNVFSIVFFSYFYYTYWKIVPSEKSKNQIKWVSILVLVAYTLSAFLQNPLTINLFYANAIGSWVLLFIIYQYFKNLKPPPNIKVDRYNLMFWISVGLVVFYTIFPFLFLIGYVRLDVWEKYGLKTVLQILIVIMYALFIIGFIISRRRAFR